MRVNVENEEVLEELSDDELLAELEERDIMPKKDIELDVLAHLNHELMSKIYKYLADNCYTYDEIMKLEDHLGI